MLDTILQVGAPAAGHGGDAPALPLAVEALIGARTADAVCVTDPEGRVLYWDAQAEALTGFPAGDVVGRPCWETLRGECEGVGLLCARGCPVTALARAGRPVPSYDMRVETAIGGRRWVNASVLGVDAVEGTYLVHLLRDAQKTHETLEMAREVARLASGGEACPPPQKDAPALTPRQAEVLGLLAAGKSAREIGGELYLSPATVRNHIRALLLALGAHSQLEALARAREAGLLAG